MPQRFFINNKSIFWWQVRNLIFTLCLVIGIWGFAETFLPILKMFFFPFIMAISLSLLILNLFSKPRTKDQ